MTREKSGPTKRRVILDMTFPEYHSINTYIIKNGVFGRECDHILPTIADLVEELRKTGPGSYLATIDVLRAYKNFMSDPLEWPLLAFKSKGWHYFEL